MRLEGGTRPGAANELAVVQLRAAGTLTAEGLRQAPELGFVSRRATSPAARAMRWASHSVAARRRQVTSNLQGLGINLPAPLNKAVETALPVRYETALTRESLLPGARLQETLVVELERIGSVRPMRDLNGAEPQVVRGTIALGLAPGEHVAMPAEGVMANIQLGDFNVDAWEDSPLPAPPAQTAAPGSVPVPRGERVNAGGMSYLPTVLAVRARHQRRRPQRATSWSAARATTASGASTSRPTNSMATWSTASRRAPVPAAACAARPPRHRRVGRQPGGEPAGAAARGSIPALDIVVDDFVLKGRKLGRLEIDAVNRGPGAVAREGGIREWRLNRLGLTVPEASFTASGNWAAVGAQPVAPGGRANWLHRASSAVPRRDYWTSPMPASCSAASACATWCGAVAGPWKAPCPGSARRWRSTTPAWRAARRSTSRRAIPQGRSGKPSCWGC